LKEFNASYEFHKTSHSQRILGGGISGSSSGSSSAAVHHQPGSNHPEMQRRRNSAMMLTPGTPSPSDVMDRPRRHTVEADMENRVDFGRYSQT
jgi:hypothetical protein